MIGIGFIGIGGMGQHQAKAFAQIPDFRIVAGSDVSDKSRDDFGATYPAAKLYSNHKDLLADKTVDAVCIAVPTGFHKDVAIDCLRAGRHVLLEKPMARTVAECRQVMDVAEKTGKVLMIAHCRRFDTDWGAFAAAYRDGVLGDIVLWRDVRAGIGPIGKWFMDDRLGGGPLIDGAIHNQDFANHVFGQPECAVGSEIKLHAPSTAIDTGSVIVRYRNGCQLLLSWSWAVPGQSLSDVLGAKRTLVFGANGMEIPAGKKGHCLIDSKNEKTLLPFEPKDMWVTQASHFRDCIEGNAKCASPPIDGMRAVAVSEAVLRAAREGIVCPIAW